MLNINNDVCLACVCNLVCLGTVGVDSTGAFECAVCRTRIVHVEPMFITVSSDCPLFITINGRNTSIDRAWRGRVWEGIQKHMLSDRTSYQGCATKVIRDTLRSVLCPKCTRLHTKILRKKMLGNLRERMLGREYCV